MLLHICKAIQRYNSVTNLATYGYVEDLRAMQVAYLFLFTIIVFFL